MDNSFGDAALLIKDAIIRSRYQAATLVNRELLGLYYAVGKYVSENSRKGTWVKVQLVRFRIACKKNCPDCVGFQRHQ